MRERSVAEPNGGNQTTSSLQQRSAIATQVRHRACMWPANPATSAWISQTLPSRRGCPRKSQAIAHVVLIERNHGIACTERFRVYGKHNRWPLPSGSSTSAHASCPGHANVRPPPAHKNTHALSPAALALVTMQYAAVPAGAPEHAPLEVAGHVFVQNPTAPPFGPSKQMRSVSHASAWPTAHGAPNEPRALVCASKAPSDAASAPASTADEVADDEQPARVRVAMNTIFMRSDLSRA